MINKHFMHLYGHSPEVFRKEIKFSLLRKVSFEVTTDTYTQDGCRTKKKKINSIDCIYNSQKTQGEERWETAGRKEGLKA